MRKSFITISIFISATLWLLITATWIRSHFAADSVYKLSTGRIVTIESYSGHITFAVAKSSALKWPGQPGWQFWLNAERGIDIGTGLLWQKIVGVGYFNFHGIEPIGSKFAGAHGFVQVWWLKYQIIWLATGIIPGIEAWRFWNRWRNRTLRGFSVNSESRPQHANK